MSKKSLCILTPAYRYNVHSHHEIMMMSICLRFGSQLIKTIGEHHQANIPVVRNHIMRKAMDTKCTHLFCCDADNWISPHAMEKFGYMLQFAKGDTPFVAAPVPMGNGIFNACKDGEMIGTLPFNSKPMTVDWVGTGLVIFNLDWYRKNWTIGPWFQVEHLSELEYISSDIWHCKQLHERKGKVLLYSPLMYDTEHRHEFEDKSKHE